MVDRGVAEVKVKTEVQIFENQKAADVAEANAELATKKAGWAQLAQLAEVESAKAVALREAELQRAVEEKNALTQLEKLKAENLSKASVEYEIKISGRISFRTDVSFVSGTGLKDSRLKERLSSLTERLEQDMSGILTTICNHSFHCSCISKWADSSCPVCRYCQQQPEKSICFVCQTSVNLLNSKVENIVNEYSELLTTQLENQKIDILKASIVEIEEREKKTLKLKDDKIRESEEQLGNLTVCLEAGNTVEQLS
ncbi:Flotillin-like protein 1 [Camellia lanceoleosa]|uniref:Flotillin-like protein 1 n=1 Tax=Camellia lanceoleosa TaxID=1840588 RepID=A0ACC0G0X4_9ERIC|nr:Flotillin-like protein 1 [Camellia lanceoleosa]